VTESGLLYLGEVQLWTTQKQLGCNFKKIEGILNFDSAPSSAAMFSALPMPTEERK